jgi:hypothetical protein
MLITVSQHTQRNITQVEEKQNLKKRGWIAALLAVFGLLLLLPQPSTAVVVWSDDFSGGFSEWTVEEGDFRVTDGYLESYFVASTDSLIWHESNQTLGTWSFDVFVKDMSSDSRFENDYMFMVNGSSSPITSYYGYGLRFAGEGSVYLVRQSGGFNTQASLRFIMSPDILYTWLHVDITRSPTGTFNVFLNASSTSVEPNITVTDTTYDYSEQFVVYGVSSGNCNLRFDNVTVNNEILITEPETTSTTSEETTSSTSSSTGTGTGTGSGGGDMTLIIAGVGGGVVVLLVAVVLLKRR